MFVTQQLAWCGLTASQAEARRLIQHRAVNLNGKVVEDTTQQCDPGDIIRIKRPGNKPDRVMQAGNGVIGEQDLGTDGNPTDDWTKMDWTKV